MMVMMLEMSPSSNDARWTSFRSRNAVGSSEPDADDASGLDRATDDATLPSGGMDSDGATSHSSTDAGIGGWQRSLLAAAEAVLSEGHDLKVSVAVDEHPRLGIEEVVAVGSACRTLVSESDCAGDPSERSTCPSCALTGMAATRRPDKERRRHPHPRSTAERGIR